MVSLIDIATGQIIRQITSEAFQYLKNWWSPTPKSASELVLEKIYHLLDAHGVSEVALLQLAPREWKWTVDTVGSPERLASSLYPEQLDWLARKFRINRGWMDGTEDSVLSPILGYKDLGELKGSLAIEGWLDDELMMSILAADYSGEDEYLGRYAIVFSHPAERKGESEPKLYQHALFETQWDWRHWPCQRDTKTVARWYSMVLNNYGYIPIVPVPEKDFRDIIELRRHPGKYVPDGPYGFDCLEDRVLTSSESTRAVHPECVEEILECLSCSGLLDDVPELTMKT